MSQLGSYARSMFSTVKDLLFSNDHADWGAEARDRHYADYRLFDGARELHAAEQTDDADDADSESESDQAVDDVAPSWRRVRELGCVQSTGDDLDLTDEDADEMGAEL